MHREVMDWLGSVKDAHPELFSGVRVLECGAYNINGSARELFERCDYVGLDWRPGPGVDVVALVHSYQPAEPFDVVISTEMLEHDPYWVASVQRMAELLRPGGVLLLTWATPARAPHELATAPVGQYYLGLAPREVAEAVQSHFEALSYGLSRGDLDGWLVGWFAREHAPAWSDNRR
jgi:SAM-dependent methyltransferase